MASCFVNFKSRSVHCGQCRDEIEGGFDTPLEAAKFAEATDVNYRGLCIDCWCRWHDDQEDATVSDHEESR